MNRSLTKASILNHQSSVILIINDTSFYIMENSGTVYLRNQSKIAPLPIDTIVNGVNYKKFNNYYYVLTDSIEFDQNKDLKIDSVVLRSFSELDITQWEMDRKTLTEFRHVYVPKINNEYDSVNIDESYLIALNSLWKIIGKRSIKSEKPKIDHNILWFKTNDNAAKTYQFSPYEFSYLQLFENFFLYPISQAKSYPQSNW